MNKKQCYYCIFENLLDDRCEECQSYKKINGDDEDE
jgi:hypothetical protein